MLKYRVAKIQKMYLFSNKIHFNKICNFKYNLKGKIQYSINVD